VFRRLGQVGVWWRTRGPPAVLLVADNPALVDLVRRYLVDLRVTLLVAPTERQALRVLRARRPGAVLLDLELGGPEEHLAQVRSLRAAAVAPVIALSASPSAPLRRQVEEAGGMLVLDKLRLGEDLVPALTEQVRGG